MAPFAFYVMVTIVVFVAGWGMSSDYSRAGDHKSAKLAARTALISPLWPVVAVLLFVKGLVNLFKRAFNRSS
jgi:hypothetical protein